MIALTIPSPEWASTVFGFGALGVAAFLLLFRLLTRKERQ